MKKQGANSSKYGHNAGGGPSERANYHNPPSSSSDRKCDNCRYKVPINECSTFKCKDCGTYIVLFALQLRPPINI